jgi:hypothetical protein
MNVRRIIFVAALFAAESAQANYVPGMVDTLQIHVPTNNGYVKLSGSPTFDGGACSSVWAAGDLNDEKFMIYIWPMLMTAKNQGKSVTVNVDGCTSAGYPRITWVQINPT